MSIKSIKTQLLEKGFVGKLKNSNISFNLNPFSSENESEASTKMNDQSDEMDFHLQIVEKVDRVIAEHEKENKTKKEKQTKSK
ncbi:MAG: hypothetical protein V5A64_06255 [Candidatus Thermoplasmatota archaeon]